MAVGRGLGCLQATQASFKLARGTKTLLAREKYLYRASLKKNTGLSGLAGRGGGREGDQRGMGMALGSRESRSSGLSGMDGIVDS